MSQVFHRLHHLGCPDCGKLWGHTTACPRESWMPRDNTGGALVPVRTAVAANAEACARECRDIAACAWPNCACPALLPEGRA